MKILAQFLIPVSELLFLGLGLGQERRQTSVQHVYVHTFSLRGKEEGELCPKQGAFTAVKVEKGLLSHCMGQRQCEQQLSGAMGRMVPVWCFGDVGDGGGQVYPMTWC